MKKLTRLAALAMAACFLINTTAFAAPKSSSTKSAKTTTAAAEETTVTDEETTTEAVTEDATETTTEAVIEETTAEPVDAFSEATLVSPFEDVDVNTETGKNIIKMYDLGILAGYNEDGKLVFKPEGNITRAELSRIFNGVFKYSPSEEQLANVVDFADNTDSEAWYYNDVRTAQVAGYINGFEDNTFRAKENFTRQQACVIIDLITGVNTYDNDLVITDEVSEWADKYVNWAVTAGLFELEEGNTFRATQNITRAEVCNLLSVFVVEEEPKAENETVDEEASTEATTEEVTIKTANGTVVKYTIGGGGGGGSTSSSSTKTNTNTNTNTTTNTTKETSTETTTAASSNNNSGTKVTEKATQKATEKATQKVTEKPTETTTANTQKPTETPSANTVSEPSADVIAALESVYNTLINNVAPNCSTAAEKAVSKQISNAIGRYLGNHSYNISAAADEAIASYRALSDSEKKELRNLIVTYANVNDLLKLQETYFPGLL